MKIKKVRIAILILLSCSIAATGQNIEFVEMENLPEARSALTSANNEESIFIVNGFGQDAPFTTEVFQYDVSQNSWSTLTTSTIPKRFASADVVGEYLYIFNGLTENGTLNSSVEKIDLADGSIEYLANNPQPTKSAGVAVWDEKIYSFGGSLESNEYSNKLYLFDPQNDTWTELADIPFAGETKGEIIDGKLYIIGGYNGTVSNSIDIYNLSSGIWESNFEMPTGISAHATAVVDDKIYLIGDFANLTSTVYFDTSDDSFHSLTNNLTPRRHCATEAIAGSLFAIGGNTSSSIQSSIASVQKADIATSINETTNVKDILVHPNPTQDFLNLTTKFERLQIYNLEGKVVLTFSNANSIDLSALKPGMYHLNGSSEEKSYRAKFVKM